jgi:hypothetical protein
MNPEEFLKTRSLESPAKFLSKGTIALLTSRISDEDPEETGYL